jgi:anti-sigma B factor antagonist
MLEIQFRGDDLMTLTGRFDASQVEHAAKVFNTIEASCRVDFGDLDYISSAGLGVLLKTQKRLGESGHSLTLANMNNHIKDVFVLAGFDAVFSIE